MPDYFWNDASPEPTETFPTWSLGYDLWQTLGPGLPETFPRLLSALMRRRAEVNWRQPPFGCPRLFVSHRKDDWPRALEIANLAKKIGFQVWVDVLEPRLQVTNATGADKAREIADLIETALLNSTHAIVVMTPITNGSRWVGYEYGRVKDSSVKALNVGCWIRDDVKPDDLPEFLLLGEQTRTDAQIEDWLRDELVAWNLIYEGACPPPSMMIDREATVLEETEDERRARHQKIKDEFDAGLREDLRVKSPIKIVKKSPRPE
jgi:hypothetical protein